MTQKSFDPVSPGWTAAEVDRDYLAWLDGDVTTGDLSYSIHTQLLMLVYGFNCDAAKNTVLEFWHASKVGQRRLCVCGWRRCKRYYIPKSTSRTCRPSCAASLSRDENGGPDDELTATRR